MNGRAKPGGAPESTAAAKPASGETAKRPRSPLLALLPLVAFSALAAIFGVVLARGGNDASVKSVLIDRPLPAFDLPALPGVTVPGLDTASLKGNGVTVVNVWGAWCGPCRQEHPLLVQLSQLAGNDFRLVGLNYKDQDAAALKFLTDLGNPFAAIGVDASGRVGIDLGVYGVPETFVVDNAGIIRAKLIAPLSPTRVREELMPAIEAARTPLPAADAPVAPRA